MAYIEISSNNVSRFVDETNIKKQKALKKAFDADAVYDDNGYLKKYTEEEVMELTGAGLRPTEKVFADKIESKQYKRK